MGMARVGDASRHRRRLVTWPMTERAFSGVTERPFNLVNLVSRSLVTGTAAMSRTTSVISQSTIGGIDTENYDIWSYIVNLDEMWHQHGIAAWRAKRVRVSLLAAGGLSVGLAAGVLSWSGAISPHVTWSVEYVDVPRASIGKGV